MYKLLIDAHCFDYNTSEGINTYIKGLYQALIPIAPDINFIFVASNITRLKSIFGEHSNVEYVALTSKNKIYRLLFEIPAIIKKYKVDYAHFQYTSPIIKNCKTIVTLHDILFVDYPRLFPRMYRLVKGCLFKISAKRADILCTVSEYSKSRIAYHYKIDQNNIIVTPNAVSEEFAEVKQESIDALKKSKGINQYILYVSRIEPRKNHVPVIKAYVDLKLWEKGYDLVFVGRPSIPVPEMDNLISSLNKSIKSHIRFYPHVSFEELKTWYAGANLFVYPAIAEGFGIPPIEAGMAGVPTICNNKTAMADFTFFDKNLIDINNEDMLKSKILENLQEQDDDKLLKIKEAIKHKYNWQTSAKTLQSKLTFN